MSPGLAVDKFVLSSHELFTHGPAPVHAFRPAEIIKCLIESGFEGELENRNSRRREKLIDLICFGSRDVSLFFFVIRFRASNRDLSHIHYTCISIVKPRFEMRCMKI